MKNIVAIWLGVALIFGATATFAHNGVDHGVEVDEGANSGEMSMTGSDTGDHGMHEEPSDEDGHDHGEHSKDGASANSQPEDHHDHGSHDHGSHDHGDSGHGSHGGHDHDCEMCVANSSMPECTNYSYPYTESDLMSCCMMMPHMIGCTMRGDCEKGGLSDGTCDSFSLLQDICISDIGMQQMGCCRNMTQLCGEDSVVEECSQSPPLQNVISTFATMEGLLSACERNAEYSGCEDCVNDTVQGCPAPLHSISQLCQSHGEDEEDVCEDWTSMCGSASEDVEAAYCGISDVDSATPIRLSYALGAFLTLMVFV